MASKKNKKKTSSQRVKINNSKNFKNEVQFSEDSINECSIKTENLPIESVNKVDFKKYNFNDSSKVFLFDVFFKVIFSFIVAYIVSEIAVANNSDYNSFLKSNQWLAYILTLISPLLLLSVVLGYSKSNKIPLFKNLKPKLKVGAVSWFLIILVPFIVLFMGSGFFNLIDYLFKLMGYKASGELVFNINSIGNLLAAIFSFAVLPAIIEEVAYRGVILNGLLSKFKPSVAILISTLLFTLMHGSLDQTLYQFFLGFIFAYVVYKTGNILTSILMHFINNALVLIINYFKPQNTILGGGDFSNVLYVVSQILLFIGALGLLFAIGFYFYKNYKNNKMKNCEEKELQENLNSKNLKTNKKEEKNKKEVVDYKNATNLGYVGLIKGTTLMDKIMFFGAIGIAFFVWLVNTVMNFGV